MLKLLVSCRVIWQKLVTKNHLTKTSSMSFAAMISSFSQAMYELRLATCDQRRHLRFLFIIEFAERVSPRYTWDSKFQNKTKNNKWISPAMRIAWAVSWEVKKDGNRLEAWQRKRRGFIFTNKREDNIQIYSKLPYGERFLQLFCVHFKGTLSYFMTRLVWNTSSLNLAVF